MAPADQPLGYAMFQVGAPHANLGGSAVRGAAARSRPRAWLGAAPGVAAGHGAAQRPAGLRRRPVRRPRCSSRPDGR
ncbi:MAG: hypothetical protein MZV63_27040 [Marinilabiliales bacterium]|nr:hypothetical protein [Marinilabiliales bacterium]